MHYTVEWLPFLFDSNLPVITTVPLRDGGMLNYINEMQYGAGARINFRRAKETFGTKFFLN